MDEKLTKQIPSALIVIGILLGTGILSYAYHSKRKGQLIFPGGITYLGQSPTPDQSANITNPTNDNAEHKNPLFYKKIPTATNDQWSRQQGKKYPVSFSYPSSLSLGVYPDDPYDTVTVFYEGTDSNANVFFRVEDMNKLNKSDYRGKPEVYVQNWWKDYAWKGVRSVTAFMNSQGLKGYRAKYTDESGSTPYDNVFFEVPNDTNLIVWLSGKLFDQATFDRMVDSVAWKE